MASSSSPSVTDRGLLLVTLPDLTSIHFLAPVIEKATSITRSSLTIIFFSRLFDQDALSHAEKWDDVQRLLTSAYVHASRVAQQFDKILMDINVLLRGLNDKFPSQVAKDVDVVFRVTGDSILTELPIPVLSVQQMYLEPGPTGGDSESPANINTPSLFPVVALGGTFDHLHAGHKILLSMAAWIARDKIIVGVTDDALLTKKAYHEVLQPLPERIENVRAFLDLFKPGLILNIVPISDVYGPTGWDPNIQALVVSKETLGGADAIASHRKSKSLSSLQVFVIDVISHSDPDIDDKDANFLKTTKMSSTYIREWIMKEGRTGLDS